MMHWEEITCETFSFLSLLQNAEVSVFEVNIRFVGGLLSAYYLSGKEVRHLLHRNQNKKLLSFLVTLDPPWSAATF